MSRNKVVLVVEGGRRPNLLRELRSLWAFREVVWAFAERDIRLKYKQTALGVVWVILQPLAFLAIFTAIFGRVGGLSERGASYPAATLCALIPWMFVLGSVSFGAQALIRDGVLIRKVYFAREAPVLGAVIGCGLDFAIGLSLLFVLAPILGARFSWALVMAIPLGVLLLIMTTGVSLAVGALTVYYRDFRYAVPLLLQLWMLASPVAYPLAAVPERWRAVYIAANPAAGILDSFRRLVAGQMPPPGIVAVSVCSSAAIAWLGYAIFKRLEAGFADAV